MFAVYPRWRGEHAAFPGVPAPKLGLSPLARGTLMRYKNQTVTCRFIPAGAGNTDY
ncbi:hypothetical protein FORC52_0911 [Salmonella enterica subsp. enterica serovar Enteritidis]|nr:hypothetical protein FORC19_0887 [Salmonella enterica]ASL52823.1 hypothetical protein FORC52_0911 [Salmonella enterica subsp. enterica serovar Enteritidis]AUC47902.1 Transcriptional regulator, LysR family [Salmonella enterica subsp. enterica serovar Typhimurium]UWN36366.1 hypothetical protein FORC89_922 [Salmonella sp. FORC89]ATD43163.1 hypothetical protein FORC51_0941 [Salmonella enterica]